MSYLLKISWRLDVSNGTVSSEFSNKKEIVDNFVTFVSRISREWGPVRAVCHEGSGERVGESPGMVSTDRLRTVNQVIKQFSNGFLPF